MNPPRLASALATIDAQLHDEAEWSEGEVSGDFSGLDGGHAEIAGCRVTNARFTGADLSRARIIDTTFTGCDLSGARIKGARLHGSTLDDLRGALDLTGVVIDGDQVVPLGVRVLAALGVGVDEEREQ